MTYQPHQSEDVTLKPVAQSVKFSFIDATEEEMHEISKTLYSVTGDIKDFNTLLVPRAEWRAASVSKERALNTLANLSAGVQALAGYRELREFIEQSPGEVVEKEDAKNSPPRQL
jgi:hypothetical protein